MDSVSIQRLKVKEMDMNKTTNYNKNSVRILSPEDVSRLIKVTSLTRYPIRNAGILLLAVDGGLTPLEISFLKRRHILGDDFLLGEQIDLRSKPGRQLRPRVIPMPFDGRLWNAMHSLLENVPATPVDPLIISERACDGGAATKDPGSKDLRSMRSTSISYVFWKLMSKAGIRNASASTARTTFIVRAGRSASRSEVSLRNVAEITGQRSLDSLVGLLESEEEDKRAIIENLI